jgi:G3E family GTPase
MQSHAKIPFFLVTGFLGSGKTTLLKRILAEYADTRRIGVIQNEFAAGNVDGQDLRRSGKSFEILEINNGSVFCVCLLADFITSLARFVDDVRPDIVILEASGLSDPIAIAQLLAAPNLQDVLYLGHVWTIVDASNALRLMPAMPGMRHQIRIADTVIINKTDLASHPLNTVEQRVIELNPFADIVKADYCEVDCSNIVSQLDNPAQAFQRMKENSDIEPCGRPDIQSAVLRSTRLVNRSALDSFLTKYGELTMRLKGFVNLDDGTSLAVQSCFGETIVQSLTDYTAPSELIAIGADFSAQQFTADFERCKTT